MSDLSGELGQATQNAESVRVARSLVICSRYRLLWSAPKLYQSLH